MQVTATVTGQFIDPKGDFLGYLTQGMVEPMDKLGESLELRMKSFCPVGKRGNLRAGVSHKVLLWRNDAATPKITVLIGVARRKAGNPTRYAHLVEFGHRAGGFHKGGAHVAAKPFVRPTAEVARGTATQFLAPGVMGALTVAVTRAKGRKDVKLIKTFVK